MGSSACKESQYNPSWWNQGRGVTQLVNSCSREADPCSRSIPAMLNTLLQPPPSEKRTSRLATGVACCAGDAACAETHRHCLHHCQRQLTHQSTSPVTTGADLLGFLPTCVARAQLTATVCRGADSLLSKPPSPRGPLLNTPTCHTEKGGAGKGGKNTDKCLRHVWTHIRYECSAGHDARLHAGSTC